jgi:hypothetical protein
VLARLGARGGGRRGGHARQPARRRVDRGRIEKLLDNKELQSRQRALGLTQSQRFDWDQAAAMTLAFYRRVLAA